jgi:GrpB-like predicted nucleotidyltransferase (UPF0157 family)
MASDLDSSLAGRLDAAGVDLELLFSPRLGPWEAWLRLRDQYGPRATVVDLYALEAASRGIRPEALTEADRTRLKAAARPVSYPSRAAVLPGSDRPGDPHDIVDYDPAWQRQFAQWSGRLTDALGRAATRIEHVGSTSVPGLAAKPVIDIQVSVGDASAEGAYLPAVEAAGLILRIRENGHLLLWPPPQKPRDVHVHVCDAGGAWERRHLLFRDYLRAHPDKRDGYAALKRELITRWQEDRKAYAEAKTAFVLDTLDDAERWALASSWNL